MKRDTTHTVGPTVAALTLGWSMLYAIYIGFVSLLVLGPRDFNGDPNSLTTNVVGGTLLLASIVQAVLAYVVMKRRTETPMLLMLLLTGVSFVIASIGLGKTFIIAFTPLHLNLALLLFLLGMHKLLIRSQSSRTDK
jgi:hypothetical protein